MQYIDSTVRIFQFYFKNLPLLYGLPAELRNPDVLTAKIQSKKDFTLAFDATVAQKYNERSEALKNDLRRCPVERPFKHTIAIMFTIRVLTCLVAVYTMDPVLTFLVGALQFLFAPFSFAVSVALFIALSPPLLAGHYITFGIFGFLEGLLPDMLLFPLEITNNFICIFFLIDQLECIHCCFYTPIGESRRFPLMKTLTHVVFGFLNCKTYTVVILVLSRGHRVNMLFWLLDAYFCFTPKVAKWFSGMTMHWAVLFYHQHRLAHLPRVYEHAHKFHHYLHDTNAFDAHIYGSGEPEEYFAMCAEVAGTFMGLTPTTLNYHTIMLSWSNKIGHTRKVLNVGGINHHCDHHTVHSKNFGIFNAVMDMYFGTNYPSNDEFEWADYKIFRQPVKDGKMVFEFKRQSGLSAEKLLDAYYNPSLMASLKNSFFGGH